MGKVQVNGSLPSKPRSQNNNGYTGHNCQDQSHHTNEEIDSDNSNHWKCSRQSRRSSTKQKLSDGQKYDYHDSCDDDNNNTNSDSSIIVLDEEHDDSRHDDSDDGSNSSDNNELYHSECRPQKNQQQSVISKKIIHHQQSLVIPNADHCEKRYSNVSESSYLTRSNSCNNNENDKRIRKVNRRRKNISNSKASTSNVGSSHKGLNTNKAGTIALFGAYGRTGNHFLRLALDAGYDVRALLLPSATLVGRNAKTITAAALQDEFSTFEQMERTLTWVPSKRLDDPIPIRQTVDNADYVVCMLNDILLDSQCIGGTNTPGKLELFSSQNIPCEGRSNSTRSELGHNNEFEGDSTGKNNNNRVYCASSSGRMHVGPLTRFVQVLYPIMNDVPTIQVFLYQGTSLANDVATGTVPSLSKLCKKIVSSTLTPTSRNHYDANYCSRRLFLYDQDMVMRTIASYHHNYFRGDIQSHSSLSTSLHTTSNSSSTAVNILGNMLESSKHGKENREHHCTDNNKGNTGSKNNRKCYRNNNSITTENILVKVSHQLQKYRSPKSHFSYIVTRPTGWIREQHSMKRLHSTKSQPSLFPITHIDLAEFSLNALVTKKLFNTCPYVVADSNS